MNNVTFIQPNQPIYAGFFAELTQRTSLTSRAYNVPHTIDTIRDDNFWGVENLWGKFSQVCTVYTGLPPDVRDFSPKLPPTLKSRWDASVPTLAVRVVTARISGSGPNDVRPFRLSQFFPGFWYLKTN